MSVQAQCQMFGTTLENVDAHVKKWGNPQMSALSDLSDAQELITLGHHDEARQAINRAKYIISEYLSNADTLQTRKP